MIGTGRASVHFAAEFLEALTRFGFAIVHQLDRRFLRHWSAGLGYRILADALVDEIFIVVGTADGPFETDRRDRAGADLRVAVGFRRHQARRRLGRSGVGWSLFRRSFRCRRFFRRSFFYPAARPGTIEDACNRRQCMNRRVVMGQHQSSKKSGRLKMIV